MSTKVPPRKAQEDDHLSPRQRGAATADCFSPPRRHDTSSCRKRHPRDDNSSTPPTHRDKPSPSHRRNDRQESLSSSTHRSEPAKSERRCLAEHQEKIAERYAQWGCGLAQVRQSEDVLKDYLEQAEKPLTRYRDDKDLDSMLKQKERQDDPMLKYLSNKTSDVSDRSNIRNNSPVKPRYRGRDPQTNRFHIWPGYRWDGLDRSNGFEKKLFASIANQYVQAQQQQQSQSRRPSPPFHLLNHYPFEPLSTSSANLLDYWVILLTDISLAETALNKVASFSGDTHGGEILPLTEQQLSTFRLDRQPILADIYRIYTSSPKESHAAITTETHLPTSITNPLSEPSPQFYFYFNIKKLGSRDKLRKVADDNRESQYDYVFAVSVVTDNHMARSAINQFIRVGHQELLDEIIRFEMI
ncbi:unnamed protein product [Rotaria sp. Silwood1]|nr:unnamed protein product [Rotaria sp. Silwood1]CAF5006193.1 unnamed protein product [Rotaria sp. Silwood1]